MRGADVVLVLTEWDEFRQADPVELARLAASPLVIDARACLPAARWRDAGWDPRVMGRPDVREGRVAQRASSAA